jgi:hypothetical protein
MPITLNHSNIAVQYSTGSNYIIETVKSDLYRRNEIVDTITRDNIQVAPVTPIISIQDGSNVYAVESYTYSGSANTADFTRVFTKSTTCDILVIGGGGGGSAGGGGGGGYVYNTGISLNGTYAIKTGKGGAGATGSTNGNQGANTSIIGGAISYTAYGGGGGGGNGVIAPAHTTGQVGSYGGNGHDFTTAQTYTSTQGNIGGRAIVGANGSGGGGGGAGVIGGNAVYISGLFADPGKTVQYNKGGQGGNGLTNNITGSAVYYAGGGTAGANTNFDKDTSAHEIVLGGGGFGARGNGNNEIGGNGTNGIGGGGGGGDWERTAGTTGGSGIVIIRYLLGTIPATNILTNEPVVVAPTFTETIRTFIHSGGTETQTTHTITVGRDTICDILIVGGGGGGGRGNGGGGGAGQLVLIHQATLNGTYSIKVGKGGLGGNSPTKGINSEFGSVIAEGGGANGGTLKDGGSGAGGDGYISNGGTAGAGNKNTTIDTFPGATVYSRGNNGGSEGGGSGGGGGGAGTEGSGRGGDGLSGISEINYDFKTNFGNYGNLETDGKYYFAGGGGGGAGGNVGGMGGGGAGGIGPANTAVNGLSGLINTGSGGGGGSGWGGGGGAGGSGIIIIKFKSLAGPILEGITHKRLNFGYNNDNLVAWYKFNGDYLDSSGNGHNLTNVGSVIQSTHIIEGQAVEFDSTDYLEFPTTINPYTIWNGNGITFSCWIRFTAHETWARLIDFQSAVNQNTGFYISIKSNWMGTPGAILVNIADGTLFTYSNWSNSIITTLGVWHHFVWSIDIAGKWDVYLNNVRINNTETRVIPNITYNLRYINKSAYAVDGTWDGQIDDFRIYDRALSATDVSLLYNKTYPIPNLYTLNFPVPTLADVNNNSNLILQGDYNVNVGHPTSSLLPAITNTSNTLIPLPTTTTSNIFVRYHTLNPIKTTEGAQWTYSSNNPNVYHLGNVGIGTTNPEYNLDVRGSIYSSIGGYTGSTLTTWSITSDRRIKENIVKASYEKCLENVNKIELYNFNFKDNCVNTNDKHQLGFIAQEVREVYPKAVEVNKMILNTNETIDDILTLNTTQIDYTLYGAVKNLIEKIDNIDIELENLGSNITYNKDLIRNTSNIFSIITSNISITTSNIFTGTSNISITTSNISIKTSNIFISTSNIPTETSNIPTETSNIPIYTSYIPFDTSNISIN